jgi:DNA-binding transcriptional LysR family regulator
MIQSRQVEAFRAVMQTGAMTAAAEALNVTQPAVSRLVRDLEENVGFPLFHRRGNLVTPTAEADALLAEVDRSFIGLGQIGAFAENLRSGRGGRLRIAGLPAMADFLPRFIADFCRDRPALRVSVDSMPSSFIRDRVVAGQLDIGIVDMPFRRDTLAATTVEDHAVLALPVGHRLAAQPIVRADDLADETLVLLRRFSEVSHPIQVALQSVHYRQLIDTSISSIACVLVAEGMGIAIVDAFSAQGFLGHGLILRPFSPAVRIGTAIVHARDRQLSRIAAEFRTEFLAHIHRFLAESAYLASGKGTPGPE